MNDVRRAQVELCAKHRVAPLEVGPNEKLGVAENVKSGELPINGMRIAPEGETCGWYLWAGEEFSQDADFFKPLHVAHLERWCPVALPFLLLPPGWRFLVAGDYSDVWYDPALLRPAAQTR